jgi:hypothetical protein
MTGNMTYDCHEERLTPLQGPCIQIYRSAGNWFSEYEHMILLTTLANLKLSLDINK